MTAHDIALTAMLGTEQNSKVFERHGVTKTVWRQLCQSAQAGEKSGRTHPGPKC